MTNDLFGQFSQQTTQMGVSGKATIDSYPRDSYIRMKIIWNPPEQGEALTRGFSEVLSTVLGIMNVSVKIKQNE